MFSKVVFLTSFLAAASAQMSISCYPLGAGGASDCAQYINSFCNTVSDDSILSGGSSGHCYNLPNGNRCDFMAFNTRFADGPPVVGNCRTILGNVTSQCGFGGSGRPSVTGYTFIVDPNNGRCS